MESGIIALQARHDARIKATKGRFNLFTVLRQMADEVGLHSRWLAFLINPKAEHDCAALFLRLFVATLRQGVQPHSDDAEPDSLDFLDSFDCDTATVRCEVSGADGRMDIIIDCPGWGIIAIENKVWADEQELQIDRYAKELLRICERGKRKFLLIFLTLDGRQSEQAGEHSDRYYRISYRYHILAWLEECMRATYSFPNINQSLQQYAALVGQLTGCGSGHDFMKELIELLKEHPALVKGMQEIQRAHEQLRQDYWEQFVRELRGQLRSRGIECGEPKPAAQKHVQLHFGSKHHVVFDNSTELRFMIERQEGHPGLWFGLTPHPYNAETQKVGRRVTENSGRVKMVTDKWASAFQDQFQSDVNEWWPLGLLNLSNDFLTDAFLAAHATRYSALISVQVAAICDSIAKFLKIAEEYWPKRAK